MLNLSELVFKVETKELAAAAEQVLALGKSVESLSGTFDNLEKSGQRVSKVQKSTADSLEKSNEAVASSAKNTTVAMDSATKMVEKQSLAMKVFRGETIQVSDEVLSLGSSFTKGQSSQLASLKLLGATTDQMKVMADEFNNFNRITSANTFDNSTAGISRLNKEIAEMQRVNEFTSRGIALTRDEIVNLVRDSERLTQQFKSEKLTADQLNQAMGGLEEETLRLAKVKNDLNAKTAESERLAKQEAAAIIKARTDAAGATAFLERELARTDNVLEGFNNSLNVTSSNRLMKFREQLKLSGVDSVTAAKMLKTYEDRLKAISEVNTSKQAKNRKDELDYLARATSVQIGDIGVSLAGGQNPLTVLIQQGDQLRGVLNQVGGDAKEMQMAMSKAFSQIVMGSVDVVKALGKFVVGAFSDAGKGIVGFITKVTGLDAVLESARYQLTLFAMQDPSWGAPLLKVFRALRVAVIGFASAMAATGVGALIAMAIGFKQVISENNTLAKELALLGGSLGMVHSTALAYVETLSKVGVTTGAATEAITAMAKAGGFASGDIMLVAKAAADMSTYAGVAIEDTVKQFAKLKEKPVEALLDLAKASGLVAPEIINMVIELEKAGKSADASALAMKAFADSTTTQIAQMKENYNGFSLFIINLGKTIKQFFSDTFKVMFLATDPTEQLKDNLTGIQKRIKEVSSNQGINNLFGISADPKLLNDLKEQERILLSQISAEVKLNGEKEKRLVTNAEEARIQAATFKMFEKTEDALDKQLKKTKNLGDYTAFYIDKQLEKLAKEANVSKDRIKLNDKEIEQLKEKAKIDWDKAQKKPKSTETKELNYYQQLMREATKETIATAEATEDLSKAQKRMLELISDPKFKAMTENRQKEVLAIWAQNHANEEAIKLKEAEKKQLDKLIAEYHKLTAARDKAVWDFAENQDKTAEGIRIETEGLAFQAGLIGKTDEERKRANKTREAQLALEKELLEISKLDPKNNEDMIAEQRLKAYENYSNRVKNINTEIVNDLNDQINKTLSTGLADTIVTALFEGGKAGAKKLRSVLVSELKRQITLNVQAQVSANMQGGIGGMQSVLGSAAQAGTSFAMGDYAGGISSLAGDLTNWSAKMGFEGLNSVASEIAGFSMEFGSVINDSIGYLGALNSALDGDYGAAIGAAIGTYFGGPIGGMIGDALGSMLGLVDTSGTFHTGGIGSYSAAQGSTYGGSALSNQLDFNLGDNTTQAAIDAAVGISTSIVKMLDSTATTFGQQAGYYAATAFADDTSDDGAWGALMLKLGDSIVVDWKKGTDKWPGREFANGEAGTKEYAAALAVDIRSALDAMDLPDWASKILGNLGDAPSIDNLSNAVTTINQIQGAVKYFSDTLGYTVTDLTGFINATGDVGAAMQSMSTYYENFYSQEERTTTLTRQMTAEFTKLGKELPTSKAAFRAMVDAAVAAGDTTLVANLLSLQGGVLSLIPAAEEVSDVLEESSSVITRTAKEIAESMAGLQSTLSGTQYDLAIAKSQDMRSTALQRESALLEASTIKQEIAEVARAKAIFGLTSEEVALYDTNIQRQKELDLLLAQNKAFEEGVQSFNNYYSLFATEEQKRADAIYRIQSAIGSEIDTTDEYIGYVNALIATYGVGSSEVKKATDVAGDFNTVFNQVAAVIETTTLTLGQAIAGLRTTNASRTVEQVAGNFLNLENELFNLQNEGNTSVLRAKILSGLSDVKDSLTGLSEVDLQNAIWAFQDASAETQRLAKEAEDFASIQKGILSERAGLEKELLSLEGNTAELRRLELEALDPSNRALKERIFALQDAKIAEEANAKLIEDQKKAQEDLADAQKQIADAQKQIADERLSLERQLLELQGNTAEIRRRELEAINPSNRALQEQIWLLQDQAEALQKANAIADERKGLEMQLLELQGNTAEIRRRELEALDPTNRALQEQIWAMEDTKKATDELVSAWQNVTDSIFEEVKRIRELFSTGSTTTLAGAKTEFDLATMLARAGDQASAERLPELSRALLEIAASQATSLTDLRRIQAATANSLEQTGNILTSGSVLTSGYSGSILSETGAVINPGERPSITSVLPVSTPVSSSTGSLANTLTSSFSNDAVVAAVNNLNANIDLLRSEVRSDVTHNAKTARLLDRVIPDGQSVQVTIAV